MDPSSVPSLMDFFKYFSRDFSYNTGVASIRAGLLKKESKGWQNDVTQSSVQAGYSPLII
jgi:terminal uridylyltransferase